MSRKYRNMLVKYAVYTMAYTVPSLFVAFLISVILYSVLGLPDYLAWLRKIFHRPDFFVAALLACLGTLFGIVFGILSVLRVFSSDTDWASYMRGRHVNPRCEDSVWPTTIPDIATVLSSEAKIRLGSTWIFRCSYRHHNNPLVVYMNRVRFIATANVDILSYIDECKTTRSH